MANYLRIPYLIQKNSLDEAMSRPLLPVRLQVDQNLTSAVGLVDSGADINVLPYKIGVTLGLNWDELRFRFPLTGNLAQFEARGVLVFVHIGNWSPLQMAFAWTRASGAPLIFGQTNFFEIIDVCFSRAESFFSCPFAVLKPPYPTT